MYTCKLEQIPRPPPPQQTLRVTEDALEDIRALGLSWQILGLNFIFSLAENSEVTQKRWLGAPETEGLEKTWNGILMYYSVSVSPYFSIS